MKNDMLQILKFNKLHKHVAILYVLHVISNLINVRAEKQ